MGKGTVRLLRDSSLIKIFFLSLCVTIISILLAMTFISKIVSDKSEGFRNAYYLDVLGTLVKSSNVQENIRLFESQFPHFDLKNKPVAILNERMEFIFTTDDFDQSDVPEKELKEIQADHNLVINRYNSLKVFFQSRHYIKNQTERLTVLFIDKKESGVANFIQMAFLLIFFAFIFSISTVLYIFVRKMKVKSEELERIILKLNPESRSYVSQDLFDRYTRIPHVINNLLSSLYKTIEDRDKFANSKFDLLTQLAHDIRTPLTSIKTSTDSLFSIQTLSEEQRSVLKSIIALDVDYLSKLVDDLLFLAVLDKRTDQSIETKNVTQMIKQIQEKFFHTQDRKKISIQYEEKNLEHIRLNELEFLRLMNNLITNGVKYSKSYFKVSFLCLNHELKIDLENDYNELEEDYVRNYGKKKAKRKIDHINKQSSIGLGSVIISSIVNKWDGSLTIGVDDESRVLKMSIKFSV